MSDQTTFVFGDDGAYIFRGTEIVAQSRDLDELERLASEDEFPPDEDPDDEIGKKAEKEDHKEAKDIIEEQDDEDDVVPDPELSKNATHVTTPGGLKGQILGKAKTVWGDQVTIRLENGRIARYDVTNDSGFVYSNESPQKTVVWKDLETRLSATVLGDRNSLLERIEELKSIKREAKNLFKSSSYVDQKSLDQIVVAADYELHQISDALAAIDTNYEPVAPYEINVVEQAHVGAGSSDWLNDTLADMIEENENTNFDSLMNEGPEMLVAELDPPALADAAVVRQMASSLVDSKTAGLNSENAQEFKAQFLARAEEVRRSELKKYKTAQAEQTKTAASTDYPDESLFF